MSGMEMMLKSFGFDPQKIRVEAEQLLLAVQQVAATMQRIESKLDKVLALQNDAEQKRLTDGTTTKPN
jgi:hypothetical protein